MKADNRYDKKKKVGEVIFTDVFQERLKIITNPTDSHTPAPLYIQSSNSDANALSLDIETHFFKLMQFLTKN